MILPVPASHAELAVRMPQAGKPSAPRMPITRHAALTPMSTGAMPSMSVGMRMPET